MFSLFFPRQKADLKPALRFDLKEVRVYPAVKGLPGKEINTKAPLLGVVSRYHRVILADAVSEVPPTSIFFFECQTEEDRDAWLRAFYINYEWAQRFSGLFYPRGTARVEYSEGAWKPKGKFFFFFSLWSSFSWWLLTCVFGDSVFGQHGALSEELAAARVGQDRRAGVQEGLQVCVGVEAALRGAQGHLHARVLYREERRVAGQAQHGRRPRGAGLQRHAHSPHRHGHQGEALLAQGAVSFSLSVLFPHVWGRASCRAIWRAAPRWRCR